MTDEDNPPLPDPTNPSTANDPGPDSVPGDLPDPTNLETRGGDLPFEHKGA